MNKIQAIKKAMLQKNSANERDIPKYVQDKAEFFEEEKGYDPGYAFSTAWSIYCKYKNPGDKEHCTKDPSEYFKGKKTAGAFKNKLMGILFEIIENFEEMTGYKDKGDLFELLQEYSMEKNPMILKRFLSKEGLDSREIQKFMNNLNAELDVLDGKLF